MALSLLVQGTMSVLADPITLVFIVIGVFVGIIFGAVPGLTATLAVIMFLPVTYTMTSVQGLSTLIALYVGGISGGLVAAILLNIPGTPSSIATTFDGAPLAAKGEAGKALGVGVVFSFVGTILGLLMLVTISPARPCKGADGRVLWADDRNGGALTRRFHEALYLRHE